MKLSKIAAILIMGLLLATALSCTVSETPTHHLATVVVGQGSVSPNSGTFTDGNTITLTALPASGWEFDHWGYHVSGSYNPTTLTMDSDKTVYAYFTEGSAETPTAIPTMTIKPTPTPTSTASRRFYGEGEGGPGDGIYSYAMEESETAGIKGRICIQGLPIEGFPGSAWPAEYPPLQPGYVLLLFMSGTSIDSYLYAAPCETWSTTDVKRNPLTGGTDIWCYSPGYVAVKFENVPIEEGKSTILPDVTLIPEVEEWVFYTEEDAQSYW